MLFRLLMLVCALALAGCAAQRLEREGLDLIAEGKIEEGLVALENAVKDSPRDSRYRVTLAQTRDRLAANMIAAGDRALAAGANREAATIYRRVLNFDPNNPRALTGLRAIEQEQVAVDSLKLAEDAFKRGEIEAAEKALAAATAVNPRHPRAVALKAQIDDLRARDVGAQYPQVKSKLARPVSLEFRDANLKMVFDVLARTSGLNFIFDKDVRPDIKVTIFVKQIAVEDAIDLLLIQSQLEKKVINDNSLLIFPATPQKLKDYQDLVIKSFYLAKADAKQTLNLIKTILKTKDVYIDEKLNLLVMRDTPDAIRIAEKLIATQDTPEAEVVLEVEVAELTENDTLNLGVAWPATFGFDVQTRENYSINALNSTFRITGSIERNLGSGKILANPRIRVKNKEKARVLIGDRVPIINSTATPAASGTGSGTTTIIAQSVQYLDIGLKLEVEPLVQVDGDVTIKLNFEVTSLGNSVTDNNGQVIAYRVGTRTANTVLQLKDNETQVLMGLIRDDEIHGSVGLPGLGQIPVLGRLFATNSRTGTRTEIALSITPRIVRNVRVQGPNITELVSGTEGALRSRPLTTRPVAEKEPAVPLRGTGAPGAAPPAPATPPGGAAAPAPGSTAAPAAGGGVALSIAGNANAKVGEEVIVALQAKAEQPLVSSALQVGFDPAAFRVVEVAEGDLFKRDGAQTTFTHRIDATTGKVFVGLSRAGGAGASGEGTILTVKLAALAEKAKSPVQVSVFSGVGPGNKLVPTTLPQPLEITVAP
jgi:general secretion pathway protein D